MGGVSSEYKSGPERVSTGGRPLFRPSAPRTIALPMDAPKVSFVSLGCAKNLVDSEVLLGHLAKGGFTLCGDYADSDVVVVNTCGFLQASERESMETIDRMVALKEKGDLKAVV